jgi:quercetin dioxygenase-like cupin family protein
MSAKIETKGQPIPLATAVDYQPGAVVSRTLLDKKAGTLTVFSFDAGQGLSEHTAPYDATVQVLDGEGEFTVGGRAMPVKAGEMLVMPAAVPHSVRAVQRFKMLLIMIRG